MQPTPAAGSSAPPALAAPSAPWASAASGTLHTNELRAKETNSSPFSLLPSSFSLLPSPFFLLPSPFFLLPSPFFLLPSPFSLLTSHFSLLTSHFLSRGSLQQITRGAR